jgi:hypothetical protein
MFRRMIPTQVVVVWDWAGLGHPELDRFLQRSLLAEQLFVRIRNYSLCLSVRFFRRRNRGFWHDLPFFLPIFTFLILFRQLDGHSFF